jgi:hypothetical protein
VDGVMGGVGVPETQFRGRPRLEGSLDHFS